MVQPNGDRVQNAVGIVRPYLKNLSAKTYGASVWPEQTEVDQDLAEAKALAVALQLDAVFAIPVQVAQPRPATLIGQGKIDELKEMLEQTGAGLLYVDYPLTPIQQRNLEKRLAAKVIDRHGLILEIFASRAQTHEGRLQVALAQQTYLKSRLVRSWTHLERQRGGTGSMAGPGESQLEIDRRLIADRIQKIKADLAKVVAGRNVQRRGRLQSELPTVALVGYTNSGKSTLFNRLTKTQSFAHDMVFATLDPTIRRVRLAGSQPEEPAVNILLSDTVGFIRDIPTQLIAAFQATLEEVVHADLLLHVYDASSVEAPRRIASVMATLNQLFSGRDLPMPPLWLVANKADLLPGGALLDLPAGAQNRDAPILVSALTGQGCALLLQALWDELAAKRLVKSG